MKNLDKLAGKVDENLQRLKEESSYIDDVGSRLSEIKKQFSSIADRDAERFDRMRKEFYSEIQSELANIKTGLGEYNRQIETYRENLQQINSSNMENTREHTAKFEVQLQEMENDFYRRINSIVDKATNLEEDMYLALNEKIQLHIQELESSSEKEINNLEDRLGMKVNEAEQSLTKAKIDFELWETRHQENLDTASRGLEQSLAEMEASREEWQNRNNVVLKGQDQGLREKLDKIKADMEEWEKNIDGRMQQYSLDFGNRESKIYQMSADIGKNIGELEQKFDRAVQSKELDMLEEVKKRQDDYKTVLEEKFIQIEASIEDIDRTKDLLKSSQENVIQDIEKQFSNFEMKMTQVRIEEKNNYDNEAGKIQEDMGNLEKELEELKARACDNVSEKLQVFEDDFLKTLKDRDFEIKSRLEEWEKNIDGRMQQYSLDFGNRESKIYQMSADIGKDIGELEQKFDRAVQNKELDMLDEVEKRQDDYKAILERKFIQIEASIKDVDRTKDLLKSSQENIIQDIEKQFSNFDMKMTQVRVEEKNNYDNEAGKIQEDMGNLEKELEELKARACDNVSEKLQVFEDDFLKTLKDRDFEIKSRLEEWEKNIDGRMQQYSLDFGNRESKIYQMSADIGKDIGELEQKFDRAVQNKELDMLDEVEKRQDDYKAILERKFIQIEASIKDVDRTKDLLKSSQENIIQDIEKQFSNFDMKMTQVRVEEKNNYDNEAGKIRVDMENLEKELEELKARAYDNVSEKLQVFEDDFFKTLKDRDAEIKSRLEEWQYNADTRLEDLNVRSNREREEIEQRYLAELDKSLNDFQNRILKQFSDFQEQTDGFRDSLKIRLHASEALLGDFQNEIRASISEHRQSALKDFTRSYSEFSTQVEGKFAKANKIIHQKLQNSADEIQKQHRMLVEEIGTSRGELSDWQNRLEIQIGEVESNTAEAVKIIKKKLADTVQELNDDFASRSEQLILCSGESQSEIKRQIIELEDALSNLTQDMNGKIQSSLDILKDQSESFLLDFRKSSRDARDEMDRKVKELRQSVQESRERAENSRREMVTHTESEYSRLMRNVDDIDRRQREFIAETRIFERADEMKEALESDMANLKAQIDSVNAGREEVRQINEQYKQSISLHTEINNRLGKLNIEQNKLEGLEARMIRINNLSDSVDLKLKQVNDANDILQGLNIKLKQLEKQHETLNDRYQHLTEKSSVLDATNDGVDNSFQLMTRLQSEIESVIGRISPLSEQIEIVRERQNRIEQDSQKVEAVVGKIGSIDSTIHELDRRVQDLLKAREWLARTESRLKEINEETHQNLRLMSTLSQGTVPKKSSGSPDMSTREIVVKLARQGWDSEEIARNTRLSQGEVELILELTPNKP